MENKFKLLHQELLNMAKESRDAQKEYFQNRRHHNPMFVKSLLEKAKDKEKKLDKIIKNHQMELSNQEKLF